MQVLAVLSFDPEAHASIEGHDLLRKLKTGEVFEQIHQWHEVKKEEMNSERIIMDSEMKDLTLATAILMANMTKREEFITKVVEAKESLKEEGYYEGPEFSF